MRALGPTSISISYERERVDVSSFSPRKVPDEKWNYIDKEGHGHFWKDGKVVPTLEWVVTGRVWVGDEYDGHESEVGEYRCRLCGEVIEPRLKTTYADPYLPGLGLYTVQISDEEFVLSEDEWGDALTHLRDFLRKKRGSP